MNGNKAKLLVVTGPSGAGLREIVGAVLESRTDIGEVVPLTARRMKEGEVNGVGYFFYELEDWNAMKESGELLETTELAGNDYGTSRSQILTQLGRGKHVILSLDAQRAAQLRANMPKALCVYLAPASREVLRARFKAISRSPFELEVRLSEADKQRRAAAFCDRTVDSDDPAAAAAALNALLDE